MTNILQKLEASILDEPRKTFDPKVWDLEGESPKILPQLRSRILNTLTSHTESVRDIKAVYIIGSIATYQWSEGSDIDVTVVVDDIKTYNQDRPSFEYEGHPVTYFFRDDGMPIQNTDAIYDLIGEVWIKTPSEEPESALHGGAYADTVEEALDWAQEIDVKLGELNRDSIDVADLIKVIDHVPDENKEEVKGHLQKKLTEVEGDIALLADKWDDLHGARLESFEKDLEKEGDKAAQTYASRNWLPENVIYKVLEKYRYTSILRYMHKLNEKLQKGDPVMELEASLNVKAVNREYLYGQRPGQIVDPFAGGKREIDQAEWQGIVDKAWNLVGESMVNWALSLIRRDVSLLYRHDDWEKARHWYEGQVQKPNLTRKFSLDDAVSEHDEWADNRNEELVKKFGFENVAYENDDHVLLELEGGYKVVEIYTNHDAKIESIFLDHCIGIDYDVEDPEPGQRFFSLRGPDGKPHVTIELGTPAFDAQAWLEDQWDNEELMENWDGDTREYREWLEEGIDQAEEDYYNNQDQGFTAVQIKGHGNYAPADKYRKITLQAVNKLGIDVSDSSDLAHLIPSDTVVRSIKSGNPVTFMGRTFKPDEGLVSSVSIKDLPELMDFGHPSNPPPGPLGYHDYFAADVRRHVGKNIDPRYVSTMWKNELEYRPHAPVTSMLSRVPLNQLQEVLSMEGSNKYQNYIIGGLPFDFLADPKNKEFLNNKTNALGKNAWFAKLLGTKDEEGSAIMPVSEVKSFFDDGENTHPVFDINLMAIGMPPIKMTYDELFEEKNHDFKNSAPLTMALQTTLYQKKVSPDTIINNLDTLGLGHKNQILEYAIAALPEDRLPDMMTKMMSQRTFHDQKIWALEDNDFKKFLGFEKRIGPEETKKLFQQHYDQIKPEDVRGMSLWGRDASWLMGHPDPEVRLTIAKEQMVGMGYDKVNDFIPYFNDPDPRVSETVYQSIMRWVEYHAKADSLANQEPIERILEKNPEFTKRLSNEEWVKELHGHGYVSKVIVENRDKYHPPFHAKTVEEAYDYAESERLRKEKKQQEQQERQDPVAGLEQQVEPSEGIGGDVPSPEPYRPEWHNTDDIIRELEGSLRTAIKLEDLEGQFSTKLKKNPHGLDQRRWNELAAEAMAIGGNDRGQWVFKQLKLNPALIDEKEDLINSVWWANEEKVDLNKLVDFHEVKKLASDWGTKKQQEMEEEEDPWIHNNVVKDFGNGYTIVELDIEDFKTEGDIQDICIGRYDEYDQKYEAGVGKYFSFRDKKNMPMATIEYAVDSAPEDWMWDVARNGGDFDYYRENEREYIAEGFDATYDSDLDEFEEQFLRDFEENYDDSDFEYVEDDPSSEDEQRAYHKLRAKEEYTSDYYDNEREAWVEDKREQYIESQLDEKESEYDDWINSSWSVQQIKGEKNGGIRDFIRDPLREWMVEEDMDFGHSTDRFNLVPHKVLIPWVDGELEITSYEGVYLGSPQHTNIQNFMDKYSLGKFADHPDIRIRENAALYAPLKQVRHLLDKEGEQFSVKAAIIRRLTLGEKMKLNLDKSDDERYRELAAKEYPPSTIEHLVYDENARIGGIAVKRMTNQSFLKGLLEDERIPEDFHRYIIDGLTPDSLADMLSDFNTLDGYAQKSMIENFPVERIPELLDFLPNVNNVNSDSLERMRMYDKISEYLVTPKATDEERKRFREIVVNDESVGITRRLFRAFDEEYIVDVLPAINILRSDVRMELIRQFPEDRVEELLKILPSVKIENNRELGDVFDAISERVLSSGIKDAPRRLAEITVKSEYPTIRNRTPSLIPDYPELWIPLLEDEDDTVRQNSLGTVTKAISEDIEEGRIERAQRLANVSPRISAWARSRRWYDDLFIKEPEKMAQVFPEDAKTYDEVAKDPYAYEFADDPFAFKMAHRLIYQDQRFNVEFGPTSLEEKKERQKQYAQHALWQRIHHDDEDAKYDWANISEEGAKTFRGGGAHLGGREPRYEELRGMIGRYFYDMRENRLFKLIHIDDSETYSTKASIEFYGGEPPEKKVESIFLRTLSSGLLAGTIVDYAELEQSMLARQQAQQEQFQMPLFPDPVAEVEQQVQPEAEGDIIREVEGSLHTAIKEEDLIAQYSTNPKKNKYNWSKEQWAEVARLAIEIGGPKRAQWVFNQFKSNILLLGQRDDMEVIVRWADSEQIDLPRLRDFQEAKKLASEWAVAEADKAEREGVQYEEHEVVKDYGNGYHMVKLTTNYDYNLEGRLMGHCVSDNYADSIDTNIYSLRDSKDRPRLTIETEFAEKPIMDETRWYTHLDDPEEVLRLLRENFEKKVERLPRFNNVTSYEGTNFVRKWLDEHEKKFEEEVFDPTSSVAKEVQKKEFFEKTVGGPDRHIEHLNNEYQKYVEPQKEEWVEKQTQKVFDNWKLYKSDTWPQKVEQIKGKFNGGIEDFLRGPTKEFLDEIGADYSHSTDRLQLVPQDKLIEWIQEGGDKDIEHEGITAKSGEHFGLLGMASFIEPKKLPVFIDHHDPKIRAQVARYAPYKKIKELAKDSDWSVRSTLYERMPMGDLISLELDKSESTPDRIWAAEHYPPSMIEGLAKDEDPYVRRKVIDRIVNPDLIRSMVFDPDYQVSNGALRALRRDEYPALKDGIIANGYKMNPSTLWHIFEEYPTSRREDMLEMIQKLPMNQFPAGDSRSIADYTLMAFRKHGEEDRIYKIAFDPKAMESNPLMDVVINSEWTPFEVWTKGFEHESKAAQEYAQNRANSDFKKAHRKLSGAYVTDKQKEVARDYMEKLLSISPAVREGIKKSDYVSDLDFIQQVKAFPELADEKKHIFENPEAYLFSDDVDDFNLAAKIFYDKKGGNRSRAKEEWEFIRKVHAHMALMKASPDPDTANDWQEAEFRLAHDPIYENIEPESLLGKSIIYDGGGWKKDSKKIVVVIGVNRNIPFGRGQSPDITVRVKQSSDHREVGDTKVYKWSNLQSAIDRGAAFVRNDALEMVREERAAWEELEGPRADAELRRVIQEPTPEVDPIQQLEEEVEPSALQTDEEPQKHAEEEQRALEEQQRQQQAADQIEQERYGIKATLVEDLERYARA